MAQSDSDSDDESTNSLTDLKNNVRGLNKATLEELLYPLMDTCAELKRDVRDLELENEILKKEKLEAEREILASHQTINDLRDTLFLNEEKYTTNQAKAEMETLELKEKVC